VFNSITGTVTGMSADSVFVSTLGIEWRLLATARTLGEIPEEGETVKIFVYLHHREDQLGLYGFSRDAERGVFLDLIKVSGIGPRQALKILSGMGTEEFVECLEAGDTDRLARIPGLGKKTAGKIVLALKGKLSLESAGASSGFAEIVEGLVAMGFDRSRAEDAVSRAAKGLVNPAEGGRIQTGPDEEKRIFKNAIILLSEYGER
jgi:holliday junction DNA helicase RuvA